MTDVEAEDKGRLQGLADRSKRLQQTAMQRYESLESDKRIGPAILMGRRFGEIRGTELGAVLALYLTTGVIPLAVIVFAWWQSFEPGSSIADALNKHFGLQGTTAQVVHDTFASAAASKSLATVVGLASFLIVAYGLGTVLQTAFARAWRVEPVKGMQAVLRGLLWLCVFLAVTAGQELLVVQRSRSAWEWWLVLIPLAVALQFTLWLLTPRLLLAKVLGWRGLVPTAVAGTVVSAGLRVASGFVIPGWFTYYGDALGSLGVILALAFWLWIVAYAWVGVAVFGAVLWERTSSPERVVEVQVLEAKGVPDEDVAVDGEAS